ncbi:MAG TPA: nickel pincer cofactor biosynthesis protein LarB, partial [Gemmatimonadales bacterium]|nr:nickel pincer cofactor biosynthesis protein LarB [Gemmatimonadales bacterium]
MTRERLARLLAEVSAGTLSPDDALEQLKSFPTEQIEFAQLDHHRLLRQGHPEVVYAAGKTTEQLVEICRRLGLTGDGFLVTRATAEQAQAVCWKVSDVEWNRDARTLLQRPATRPRRAGTVLLVAAGTSDLPAIEEAAVTLGALGIGTTRLVDVGVAGLHRLLAAHAELRTADVIIVAAGMEGALPSVVGGLVGVPVVALPTSVGYGASFDGLAALLAML